MNDTRFQIRFAPNRGGRDVDFSAFSRRATALVRRVQGMAPDYDLTPLRSLESLALRLGVRRVLVKDESARFGLKAFKGLGGIYVVYRLACRELGLDPQTTTLRELMEPPLSERVRGLVFATTTDGNHGKGVSWAAGLLDCASHVFMPRGSVEARAEAIRRAGGAEVTITDMTYDECVTWTRQKAAREGWLIAQDTDWPGCGEVPLWIMQGYTTLLFEALDQIAAEGFAPPTHILLQAGVGSMAGAVAAAAMAELADCPPVIVTVEPNEVACFYESFLAADGAPHPATGSGETIMAGLNCAVPCALAWEMLSGCALGGYACPDEVTRVGMRLLADPYEAGEPIVSGESGGVTTGLLACMTGPENAGARRTLKLTPDSTVLVINTEGDTDPENYAKVVGRIR